jgi:aminopeptidase N
MFKKIVFIISLLFVRSITFAQQAEVQNRTFNSCSHSQIQKLQKIKANQLSSLGHIARMNQFDVKFYFLNINLERTSTYITGKVTIKAEVKTSPLDTFSFELHQDLSIDSVKVNGQLCTVSRNQGEANAKLISPLSNSTIFDAEIWYKGTPPSGASAAIGNGISNGTSQSWGNRITWTLSQPYAAYEWFPCKQVLADKADSVWVWVTTDISNKVGSNGLLQKITPISSNKHRYEWRSNYPIAYYLISVAVGEYVEYNIYAKPTGYQDSILIQNYIYNNPNTLPYFQNEINKTKDLLELYSDLYGLYPFHQEKYGHSMAPFSGGMEHQTMTTQGFFNFTLTAHELAHQWFGDWVTCDTWADIWLNEGFASYSEYLALQYLPSLSSETASSWMNDVHNNVMSSPGGSVFVPDTANVPRIFSSRLTYDKGAAIIHTLRFVINNDSLFFLGLKNYLQQYGSMTATAQNFKTVMENTANINLNQFFDQWYYGEGYPTFDVRWFQVGNQLIMKVNQTTSTTITPLFITPIEYRIRRQTIGDTIIRVFHTQPTENYIFTLNGTVTNINVDPNNWIINQATVAKDQTLSNSPLLEKLHFEIYPNPGNEILHIQGNHNEVTKIKIYDVLGKLIYQDSMQESLKEIHVSNWLNGTYIVELENSKGKWVKKYQKL